jgi:hypothetical protein
MITRRILTEEEYILIREFVKKRANIHWEQTDEEKEICKILNIRDEDY